MQDSNVKKRRFLLVLGPLVLFITAIGLTYAFFNYTRTGSSNTIRVGRVSFVSKNEQTISLSNLFPIDPTETGIMNDSTKVGTYSVDIEGDADYVDGVEYLVSITDANIYTSTGKTIPISINVTTEDLGTPNDNYFTTRESKDTLMYKKIIGDTIVGDGMLLVGYIPQNNPTGTADGVDGSITIKAYLDKNKILISDTFDGTESDPMGTTNNQANGKTVLTTTEWNAIQSSGVSFKIKVEANGGIWVKGSLEEIMKTKNYSATLNRGIRDNENSDYVDNTTPGINFGAISSDTNGKGVYMRAGTQNDTYPILYYRGEVTDNNVKFGNYCWKVVRTTDTGGVKLIYNGESSAQNGCNNTGTSSQLTLNVSGTDTNTFKFSGDNLYKSPAYNGYMWGTAYEYSNLDWISGAKFGSSFTWDGTNYTLVDATETTPNQTHHYSCNSTDSTATCTDLLYVYYWTGNTPLDNNAYYITLQNGKGINDAIAEMQTNTTSSNAKTKIETWYASNMTSYTSKIEDTIYCNDRSMNTVGASTYTDNGWKADGNLGNDYLHYSAYGRLLSGAPSLTCSKNDSFTWKSNRGNQKLGYPVAMLSSDEIILAGGSFANNETYYLNSGSDYWSMSPHSFYYSTAIELRMYNYGYVNYGELYNTYGLRPVISLKPGTLIASGTGTVQDPYVIR